VVDDGIGRHTPQLSGNKIVRALSIDDALISHVSDAIAQLSISANWVEVDDPIPDVVAEAFEALDSWYLSSMFIGQVSNFLGALPPFWLPLLGDTYDRGDYPELWLQLDAQYKDSTTFTLPDCSDLFLAVAGSGTYALGDTGGENEHTLTTPELPGHTHTYLPPQLTLDIRNVGAPTVTASIIGPLTPTSSTGDDNPHENRPPYYALTMGVFAGRD
jgi:hypothetical protein